MRRFIRARAADRSTAVRTMERMELLQLQQLHAACNVSQAKSSGAFHSR